MSQLPKFYGIVAYDAAQISGQGRYYYTDRFKITYETKYLIDDFPSVGIESEREGGLRSANCWLSDHWALEVIKQAKAEWFIPFMKRLAQGEIVPMWEVAREYEACQGRPMQLIPQNLPGGLKSEDYSCAQFSFLGETSPIEVQSLPVTPSIRDASWRGIIACDMQGQIWSESDYCIAYCRNFYQGKPGLYIRRGQKGGMYAMEQAWQDAWCREQFDSAKVNWFLPYWEFMVQGGIIGMWELQREMEMQVGHSMYQLPPGIPLDDQYCEWFSLQTRDLLDSKT